MSIWDFQKRLTKRLLGWSFFSIGCGLFMLLRAGFWRKMGVQFVSWGAIDALIALGGQYASDRRQGQTTLDEMPQQMAKDTRNLKIALWINAGLDVFYVLGSRYWMSREPNNNVRQGTGWGVIIQGLFLLLFDVYHALKIREVR